MLPKPSECNGCALEHIGNGFSKSDGLGTSGVAIVGECLEHNDSIEGLPFSSRTQGGSKLKQCIKIAGDELGIQLTRNHFLLTNIIACNPPGDRVAYKPYEFPAIKHCEKNFTKIIPIKRYVDSRTQIRAMVALGDIPLQTLTGILHEYSGDKQSISDLRGFPLHSSKFGIPVIPCYDPGFIKRGKSQFTPYLIDVLKKAIKIANVEITDYPSHKEFKKHNYIETPSLDVAWSFYNYVRDNSNLPLSYDIETEHSSVTDEETRDEELKLMGVRDTEITQIQFSYKKRMGIAFPWKSEYIEVVNALFRLTNPKFGFNNWSFDDPRLTAKGVEVNNKNHSFDVMVMFSKWHPNLERGLQKVASLFNFPFPWKHLFGNKLAFYGCADVASVIWIIEQLIPLMRGMGNGKVWQNYVDQVYRLKPILDTASDLGIPVNEEKRIKLKGELEEKKKEYLQELQALVPDEIKTLEPKRTDKATGIEEYGFKRTPKIITESESTYVHLRKIIEERKEIPASFRRFIKRKYGFVLRTFTNGNDTIERWCRQKPFNPSSQQVIKYLEWKRKELQKSDNEDEKDLAEEYEIPINLKTKRVTTGKKDLQEIFDKTGDLVLDKALRVRSLTTNITNYIPNWKPDNDGRVHCEWGFLPPQGQLTSKSPNIQNLSAHTEIGQQFRRIVEAPIGYVFIECDYKSFHVCTLGYCANDETYIRFSQLDPHSIFISYVHPDFKHKPVEFSWSDNDIKQYCKEIKKWCLKEEKEGKGNLRQELAKPCVLGNQLGLGPKKLWLQNRRVIKNIAHAKELQIKLAEMFPKVERFKEWCIRTANNQGYLITDWGCIQQFYDVFMWVFNKRLNKWEQHRTNEAEKCLAKMVQGTAFGLIKDKILKLDKLGYNKKFNFVNTIHDSLQFMPSVEDKEKCIEIVKNLLQAPCETLKKSSVPNGLQVGVEVKMGRNWQDYDKETNIEGMQEL